MLDTLGLTWWVEAGTCLGIVRDQTLIAHDSDLDFGVLGADCAADLLNRMGELGYRVEHIFGAPQLGLELSFRKHGVKSDFFFFYKNKQSIWHAAHLKVEGEWVWRRFVFPSNQIIEPTATRFQHISIKLPARPAEYLRTRYGDWQRVVREWDWWSDPLCAEKHTRHWRFALDD